MRYWNKVLITLKDFIRLMVLILGFSWTSCRGPVKRETIKLSGEWNFYVDSVSNFELGDCQFKELPPDYTRKVTVPHTWNVEEGLEGYRGKCWYEREFLISGSQLKKITRLQFNGVYHSAVIFINGIRAGEHIGSGYNRFYVDVTSFLKTGRNKLTLCVDNSFSRYNIPFLNSYDWANDGGIYREVYALITDKYAIRNVHVSATPDMGKGKAVIKVNFLDPGRIDQSKLRLQATVTEENQSTQHQVFHDKLKGRIENGSFVAELVFDQINPWHFDAPNLYRLDITLFTGNREKDRYSTVFGFRSISVSKDRYILNGEPMRIIGVEWMPGSTLGRGMAENHSDMEKNLRLMKNANCIFTRFHWQQDEFVLDWCDRNGIMVQEEIPSWGGRTILNDTLLQLGIKHLDEMTDNHYNHPSIISWGIGNELQSKSTINKSSLRQLYDHAKKLDTSRQVNYVSNELHSNFPSETGDLPDATADFDIMMFNEYFSSWFGRSMDVLSYELDRIAVEYPDKPLVIAEFSLCEPMFKGGDKRRVREMTQQINIYNSKHYIAGAIYFCLNDYRTHMGEDTLANYPQRRAGVCDIRLNPKPSYETLKLLSSPLEVKSITRKDGRIRLKISGKDGLPGYIIRNYSIIAGNEIIKIDELKPGEEKVYDIKSDASEIIIIRPTGFEVLKKKYEI